MFRRDPKGPAVGAIATFSVAMLVVVGDARAAGSDGRFSVYGDFRGRLEHDWDSTRGDGTERDDRGRLRVRARIGLKYNRDKIEVGVRLRSGPEESQQSPHITVYDFDDNPTGDADFNLDKWYLQYKTPRTRTFVGRNSIPWWFQDELIWDDDITPAGVGFAFKEKVGKSGKLMANAGFFTLPEGMRRFRGDLLLAQLVHKRKIGNRIKLVLAGGYLDIDADTEEGDSGILLQGNELRDYSTIVVNGQWNLEIGRNRLQLGADYYLNTESYDDESPGSFDDFHKDEDTGYTVFATWGGAGAEAAGKDKREDRGEDEMQGYWRVGAYYTRMEMFAFNSSYMQDDWVRWGNMTQTRSSNFKGTELRGVYGFNKQLELVARLYLVDGIQLTNPGDVAKEDGNRFRLDLNFRF